MYGKPLFLMSLFALQSTVLAQVPILTMAEAAKRLNEGGYVLLMRHTATDGQSDPPSYKLNDCSSQLTLSNTGKEDAKKIGEAFKTNGIKLADVSSSEFCRCQETAKLAFGGATVWPALNSYAPHVKKAEVSQTAELKAVLAYAKAPKNFMWVTHQTNITSLTGFVPAASEVLAIRAASQASPKPDKASATEKASKAEKPSKAEKANTSDPAGSGMTLAFRFSPLK